MAAPGGLEPGQGAFADQFPLELGQRREDAEDETAGRGERLSVFDRTGVPKHLRPLLGGKVNVDLIDRNWADVRRVAATMAAGIRIAGGST